MLDFLSFQIHPSRNKQIFHFVRPYMGKPVNIESMARDLIRFSGMEPDRDIKIEYTGLRPGEKFHEELMVQGENVLPSSHDKILVLKTFEPETKSWEQSLAELFQASEQRNPEKIREILQVLVPEYHPWVP